MVCMLIRRLLFDAILDYPKSTPKVRKHLYYPLDSAKNQNFWVALNDGYGVLQSI